MGNDPCRPYRSSPIPAHSTARPGCFLRAKAATSRASFLRRPVAPHEFCRAESAAERIPREFSRLAILHSALHVTLFRKRDEPRSLLRRYFPEMSRTARYLPLPRIPDDLVHAIRGLSSPPPAISAVGAPPAPHSRNVRSRSHPGALPVPGSDTFRRHQF